MTEAKRCKYKQDAFHCGSYAFNLDKEGINQNDLCDVHYWKNEFMKALAASVFNFTAVRSAQAIEIAKRLREAEQIAADSMDQQD